MALDIIFSDGLDSYAADADLATKWDFVDGTEFNFEASGGRFGSGAIRIFDNQTAVEKYFAPVTEIRFACSIKAAGAFDTGGTTDIIEFQNRQGEKQVSLRIDDASASPPGNLLWFRDLTLVDNTGQAFTLDTWHTLEIYVKIGDSSNGAVDVRIDGSSIYSADPVDTQGNAINDIGRLVIRGYDATGSDGLVIDDVVLYANDDFLGSHRIQTLRPDGAGNSSDWTPSAGTRHEAVDEQVPDDDTTYVSESTLNDSDLYTVDDPASSPQTVHAVVVNNVSRATGTTPKAIRAQVRHGSTTGNGSAVNIPDDSAYHLNQTAFTQNPDTASAWTADDLSDLEIGQDLNG